MNTAEFSISQELETVDIQNIWIQRILANAECLLTKRSQSLPTKSSFTMCKAPTTKTSSNDTNTDKKKSLFGKLKRSGSGKKEDKPKKEKKIKPIDPPKADTSNTDKPTKEGGASLSSIFSKEKKKPRAEYQQEIDDLTVELEQTKDQLAYAKQQLTQSQTKYNQLQRWARNPPL